MKFCLEIWSIFASEEVPHSLSPLLVDGVDRLLLDVGLAGSEVDRVEELWGDLAWSDHDIPEDQ